MNLIVKFFFSIFIFMSMASVSQADVLLKDVEGNTISFSSLRGKWVLINYWASWCTTCISEIPQLNRFYRQHEKTALLFAVNYDALPLYKQKKLIKKLHILYPSLATDPASALDLGDIIGVPVTFVINPQGKLVNTLYGGQNVKTLKTVIGEK